MTKKRIFVPADYMDVFKFNKCWWYNIKNNYINSSNLRLLYLFYKNMRFITRCNRYEIISPTNRTLFINGITYVFVGLPVVFYDKTKFRYKKLEALLS